MGMCACDACVVMWSPLVCREVVSVPYVDAVTVMRLHLVCVACEYGERI